LSLLSNIDPFLGDDRLESYSGRSGIEASQQL
jgi:hypothetical protein